MKYYYRKMTYKPFNTGSSVMMDTCHMPAKDVTQDIDGTRVKLAALKAAPFQITKMTSTNVSNLNFSEE